MCRCRTKHNETIKHVDVFHIYVLRTTVHILDGSDRGGKNKDYDTFLKRVEKYAHHIIDHHRLNIWEQISGCKKYQNRSR